ncbi:MAG: YdiY family protein [Thermodesulfobacteriota bacterium]
MSIPNRRLRPPAPRSVAAAAAAVLFLLLPAAPSSAGPGGAEGATPAAAWKARAEVSYVNTSGNTETQTLAGKFDLRREGPVNRLYLSGSGLFASSNGEETSNKLALDSLWERAFTPRFFGLLAGGYSRDRFSGYDFRAFGGPGVGYELIKTDRQRLKGVATLLYYHDEFSKGAASTDNYPSGKFTAGYELRAAENLKFVQNVDFFGSLEDTGRFFFNSTTSVEVKVNALVSLGVSYTINYQNEPPSPEVRHLDKTLLTTLIFDF